jgi:hypothetical protein
MAVRFSTLFTDAELLDLTARAGVEERALATRLDPAALVARWDRQQWVLDDLRFGLDAIQWRFLDARTRSSIEFMLRIFAVGEYTGLDLLAPIQLGAPAEADLMFLATQAADEARHFGLLMAIDRALLGGDGTPRGTVVSSWRGMAESNRFVAAREAEVLRDALASPLRYDAWLRAVTFFHLLTEAVLAIHAQRRLIHALRGGALPGLCRGFTLMLRDEARHASYGVYALRCAVENGHGATVREALREFAPLVLSVDSGSADPNRDAQLVAALRARIKPLAFDDAFTDALGEACAAAQARARAAFVSAGAGGEPRGSDAVHLAVRQPG